MLLKANELNFKQKPVKCIIAGLPGIGKTTLGMSAPKPLLIDLDNGIARTNAYDRTNCDFLTQLTSYQQFLDELKEAYESGALKDYETLVVDTGGKMLDLIKPYVIAKDPKNAKTNGDLSIQGYGQVLKEFRNCNSILTSYGKNVVWIFHASEVNLSNDVIGLRIRIEGQSKNEVWDDIDVGGFIEMVGENRVLSFKQCERYFAKRTGNCKDTYIIPKLEGTRKGQRNNLLAKIFDVVREGYVKEVEKVSAYESKMKTFKESIDKLNDLNEFNDFIEQIKTIQEEQTIKIEIFNYLTIKAKEKGFDYDKETKHFKASN